MNLIFYSREDDESSRQVMDRLLRDVEGEKLVVCRTASEISKTLFQSTYNAMAAVLSITDPEDLQDLLSIQDALQSVKVILILPDMRKEFMSELHVFHPRLLVQRDEGPEKVAAVIGKIRACRTGGRKNEGNDDRGMESLQHGIEVGSVQERGEADC